MLDYIFYIGVLLLVAPFTCMMTKDFEDCCVGAMLIQALVAIALVLVGFGVIIK